MGGIMVGHTVIHDPLEKCLRYNQRFRNLSVNLLYRLYKMVFFDTHAETKTLEDRKHIFYEEHCTNLGWLKLDTLKRTRVDQ